MTPQERKRQFDALLAKMPGEKADKLNAVADLLFCKPDTVRIWALANPPRVIPEHKLKMLQRLTRL